MNIIVTCINNNCNISLHFYVRYSYRLCVGSYESYMKYVSFNETDSTDPIDQENGGQQSWSNYVNEKLNKKSTWLLFTIVSTTALVILLLIIIFLRKRIRLSIALIVEGSR